MANIRITKEFKFETSHILKGYDGLCRNIHGHSYRLLVTIRGEPMKDNNHPKLGMIMDFGDLKKIVNREIVDKFDHTLIVNEDTAEKVKKAMLDTSERVMFVPYQPTSENMVADIAEKIKTHLPAHVTLVQVRLFETATSFADWLLEENQ